MMNSSTGNYPAEKFSQFCNSRMGLILLSVWAFLEPSFWFIAPDMLLILMCLYSPKNYRRYAVITLVSALLGASLYFLLNLFFFDALGRILLLTPFVTSSMISRIGDILTTYGLDGLLFQSVSFMSVKIWIHLAVERNIPFLWFILLTGASRALRFFLVALVSRLAGIRVGDFLKRYFMVFVASYLAAFILLLVLAESSVGFR